MVNVRHGQTAIGLHLPALVTAGLQRLGEHTLLHEIQFVGVVFGQLLGGRLQQLVQPGVMLLNLPDDFVQCQPVHHPNLNQYQCGQACSRHRDHRPGNGRRLAKQQ